MGDDFIFVEGIIAKLLPGVNAKGLSIGVLSFLADVPLLHRAKEATDTGIDLSSSLTFHAAIHDGTSFFSMAQSSDLSTTCTGALRVMPLCGSVSQNDCWGGSKLKFLS